MHYILTVYREDDETPLFEVGTSAAHSYPYLHALGEMDLGEVDLLAGKAMIGQVNLAVIDPQTGPTQAERWMTARLGIPAGEVGAGHSALNGRRAVLRRSDGRIIMDGVIWGVQLSDTAAGFRLQLRDVRERARKLPLFTSSGTSSVLPRGVIPGYGKLPSGGWLVPPTKPLRARVVGGAAGAYQYRLLDLYPHHWELRKGKYYVSPELVRTEAMRAAVQPQVVKGVVRCPDVTVLWRTVGTSSWQEIAAPIPASPVLGALLLSNDARVVIGGGEEVLAAVTGIALSTVNANLPPVGAEVETIIRYDGPPSEQYPRHFEGPAGVLIRNALRGDYGAPTKLRYDEAEVLKLTTPARVRLTKPVEDARPWLEQAHQQLGAAPALDVQGRISPVLAALPPVDVQLPVITEANAKAIPGWEHPADRAVTVVAVKYQRDYLVRAIDDPLGERSAGDGIASIDVPFEYPAPKWARDLVGDHPLEIDGWLFRAIGGAEGDPVTGGAIDETGAQVLQLRAREIIDRWLFGGQTSFVRVLEADFPDVREGSWVLDERPWRPNYREGKRGGSTLAQVASVRSAVPGWLDLRLIDAGPADQPLTTPAIGPLSAADTGGVSVPVTAVPVGGEVAVYYAISDTTPGVASNLWTFAGRVSEVGTVETPPVPAGSRVYARARSEAPGRRPSTWSAVRQITLPIVATVQGVRPEIDSAGEATVRWEPGQHTAGVRIYYRAVSVGGPDDPLTTYIDRAASALSATLPIVVGPLQALRVEVEPWTGWTGSAVSGTAGERVGAGAIAASGSAAGVRWRGEHAAPPPDPWPNDAYRNTLDGTTYIYVDGDWEVMSRDGQDGKEGPSGPGVLVRYSGPEPGENISDDFDPQVHTHIQWGRIGDGLASAGVEIMRVTPDGGDLLFDLGYWSEWGRMVGVDGAPGPQGEQGTPGPKGEDGRASYFHVAYATSADGSTGFNQTAGPYIGTYVDFNPTDSLDYRDYTWRLFEGAQGPKGDQGIPGVSGEDGQTSYLHIKYSDDGGATFTANNGETPGKWIGQYVDFEPQDSNNPADYTWKKIEGPQGPQGPKGQDGAQGPPGTPALTAVLSNDSHVIPTASDGSGGVYTGAATTITVFSGAVDDTAAWTIAATPSTGVTGSLAGRTYTVTGMSADAGYVDLKATRAGYPTLTVRFALAKAKGGIAGGKGDPGAPATAYWLVTDVAAIRRNPVGAYTPAALMISGRSATGSAAPTSYAGRFVIATLSGGTWTDRYTSAANESSRTYTPPAGVDAVRVRLYLAGGTTTLLDEETIAVVEDGHLGPSCDVRPAGPIVGDNVTISISGRDRKGGTTGLVYRERAYTRDQPPHEWPVWKAMIGGFAPALIVPVDPRYDTVVEAQVRDAEGLESIIASTVVPAGLPGVSQRGWVEEVRNPAGAVVLDALGNLGAMVNVPKRMEVIEVHHGQIFPYTGLYDRPPLVVYVGGGVTWDSRERWVSEANKHLTLNNNGRGPDVGGPFTVNPPTTAHAVTSRFIGEVLEDSKQILFHCLLMTVGSPQSREATFGSTPALYPGQWTGVATPNVANLPAVGDTFTISYELQASWMDYVGVPFEYDTHFEIDIELSTDGGTNYQVVGNRYTTLSGFTHTLISRVEEITVVRGGLPVSSQIRWRLKFRDAIVWDPEANIDLAVRGLKVTWQQDAGTLYASATPTESNKARFLIMAQR